MATVNNFTKAVDSIPKREVAIIICPVEDTGKNSVSPSMIAKTNVSNKFIYYLRLGFINIATNPNANPAITTIGANVILVKL